MGCFELRIFSQLLERVRHTALRWAKDVIAVKLSSRVQLVLAFFICDRMIHKRKC